MSDLSILGIPNEDHHRPSPGRRPTPTPGRRPPAQSRTSSPRPTRAQSRGRAQSQPQRQPQAPGANRHRRRAPKKKKSKTPIILLSVLAVVIVAVAFGRDAVTGRLAGVPDYSGSGEGSVSVQVADGDTSAQIAATLVKKGVVKSAQAFSQAADANPESRSIQPGFYQLHKKMSGQAALSLMLSPEARAAGITIPEGSTVAKTLEILASKTHASLDDLKAAAKNTEALGLPPEAKGQLEGFLYPTTYSFGAEQTPTEMLKMMVDAYRQNMPSEKMAEAAARFGISEYDVLIVASLVEKEGITPDFGKVSRVVYNRLAQGMRLQFDSTINYALGRNNIRVSAELLQTDSPYNTYRNAGLPPTPIGNPGQAAMNAALNPDQGPWLYFVKASKDGTSFFTDKKAEFDQQVAKARAEGVF